MKLVSYIKEGHEQLAMLVGNTLYNMDTLHPELPSTMSMFLNYWDDYFPLVKNIHESIEQGKTSLNQGIPAGSVNLISPVPFPASCRRAIVSEGLTNGMNQNSGDTSPYPAYHFINHHCVQGPGEVNCMPDHFNELDFEMGVAIVVSSHCTNITAEDADQYIGGYLIMNRILAQEDLLNKDIANVLGPWLVTPDELEPFVIQKEDHVGDSFDVAIKCSVNGKLLITNNLADINWTFAEILQSCAYGADLQPGDVIGTGSVIMGCYLNLNQTGMEDPNYSNQWLQKGDIVEIEIEGLGVSTITIAEEDSSFSLSDF